MTCFFFSGHGVPAVSQIEKLGRRQKNWKFLTAKIVVNQNFNPVPNFFLKMEILSSNFAFLKKNVWTRGFMDNFPTV